MATLPLAYLNLKALPSERAPRIIAPYLGHKICEIPLTQTAS